MIAFCLHAYSKTSFTLPLFIEVLSGFGPLGLFLPNFNLFGFPMFRFKAYLMKVIPETPVRTKFDIYDYIKPSQESERSCICVIRVSILPLSTILIFDFGTVRTDSMIFLFFHFNYI